MNRRAYRAAKVGAEILVPIAILVAWQLWTVHAHTPKFPRLSTILVEFKRLWLFAQFGADVVPSLERIAVGYGAGVVLGVALGLPLGLSLWARRIAMPHLEYWRAMPPPALLPISFILLHSIGNLQKVSFIAFFCFFPVLLNTIVGLRNFDPDELQLMRSLRASHMQIFRKLLLPGALPMVFGGLKTSMTFALLGAIVGELTAAAEGIGSLIDIAAFQLRMDAVYGYIMWLSLVSLAIFGFMDWIDRRVVFWRDDARKTKLTDQE